MKTGSIWESVRRPPVNDYRSGEKIVLNAPAPADFTAEVTIDFRGSKNARDAGLLFRTTAPSIGHDAQRGYFAGLIPSTNRLVVGQTDGSRWTELARESTDIDPTRPQRLQVTCKGTEIIIHHNGSQVLNLNSSTSDHGSVGFRVVDSHAVFSDFSITRPR